ncbi:MAG: DMT family transporter [Acidimicrobiia bacterium]
MAQFRNLQKAVSGRRAGIVLACVTGVISGFAVFINGYGIRAWAGTADATTYTTFKNIGAALVLVAVAVALTRVRSREGLTVPSSKIQWLGLATVAVLGGALAFALFFEGLSRASSVQAGFIHKTLVVWVAILAVGILRENLRPVHLAAVALLIAGQLLLVGGVGDVTFGMGELMILGATLLWSIEVVLAKRLLAGVSSATVGVARMAGGALVLIAYGLLSGGFATVGQVTLSQWGWIALTAIVLAGYVGTWFAALARAPAIDVTAILVGGAVITALLRGAVGGVVLPSPLGLALVALGSLIVAAASLLTTATHRRESVMR